MSRRNMVCGLVAAVLLAGLSGSVSAQEQRRGRFFGGPGGPGGFGGADIFRLAGIPDVADSLKLNDDQRAYVKLLVDEMREEGEKLSAELRDLPQEERRERFRELGEKMRGQRSEREKQLAEIVGEDKVKRLRQITWQLGGPGLAFGDPRIGEELKITDDQREKAREGFMAAGQEMRELFRNAGDDPDARRKAMADFRKKQEERVVALLTDDQKNKWKELVGEPAGEELLGKIRAATEGFRRGGPGGPPGQRGPDRPARKGERKKKDA